MVDAIDVGDVSKFQSQHGLAIDNGLSEEAVLAHFPPDQIRIILFKIGNYIRNLIVYIKI